MIPLDTSAAVARPGGERIPVSGPWITEHEVALVADAARTAWYEHAGDYVRRFELAFASYVGRRHAVALPSCTSGLHLALLAAGIGPGDRVAVPDLTWIASAAPVSYVGAEPVFVDVDAQSWCMDAEALAAVAPDVQAAIVVDLYGNMPDWGALARIAEQHDIVLIEDAAEAIGSTWSQARAGSFGATSVFSFHGSKTLTTGEGGMLLTDSDEIVARVRFLADHGRLPGDVSFRSTEVAHKYKMSALQAALGLGQLERVEELVERKRTIFSWYSELLADCDPVTLNSQAPAALNSYWMVTAVWPELAVDKFAVIEALASHGIDSRPIFSPLSSIPAYERAADRERARAANAVSYAIGERGVNLPSGLLLERHEAETVAVALNDALGVR